MSKNYHSRLDKLEDELQSLLLLQEASTCQQRVEIPCPGLSSVAEMPYEEADMEEDEEEQQTWVFQGNGICPAYSRRQMESENRCLGPELCPERSRRHLDQQTPQTDNVKTNPKLCPNYKLCPAQPDVDKTNDGLVIEELYIREESSKLLENSERRRSSSAPPENQPSNIKPKGPKKCTASCSKRISKPEYDTMEESDHDPVSSKFNYAIEQLRIERQQFKELQEANNKLRDMLASTRASAKEATDSRRTSLDYSRQMTERLEQSRLENQELRKALEQMKAENQRLSEDTQSLQMEVGSTRRATLQSEEDKNALVVSIAKTGQLEQQLKECNKALKEMDVRYQELVKQKRDEENTLSCAVRDSETRARDAEARVRELEERAMMADRRAEETEKKRKAIDQDLRNKETLLHQETLRRKSVDESAQAELKRCQEQMIKMSERQHELETQRDSLEKLLHQAQQDVQKKIAEQEEDFNAFRESCREKEEQIARERIEMAKVVQELKGVAKEHMERVDELTEISRQQDKVIASQKEALQRKDDQIVLANQEVDAVRMKSADLDMQVRNLRRSVDSMQNNDDADAHAETRMLLAKAKQALDVEKDKTLIKDKIIDDQAGTIKQLKMQLQDRGDNFRQGCKELEQQLKAEIKRAKKLEMELEDCMWNKQELEARLNEMEEDRGKCPAADSFSRHDHLLRQLELQIESKQKEWELQMKLMQQEKDTACNAAKFATRKLEMVAMEFRKKLATYEKVQRLLSAMLKEKDGLLAEANEKIREANFKVKQLSMAVVCSPPLPPPLDMCSDEEDDYQCDCVEYSRRQPQPQPQPQRRPVRPSGRDNQCIPCSSRQKFYHQSVRSHPYQ